MNKLQFSNYQEKITLLINYMLIIYAFLLPFNTHLSNKLFQFIAILFLFSGNLKEKLLFALKNRVVQALTLFYLMYLVLSYNSHHFDWIVWKLKEFKYLFYIIIFLTVVEQNFKKRILNAFILSVLVSEALSYLMYFNVPLHFVKITGYGNLVPFFYTYSQYVLLILIVVSVLFYRILKNDFQNIFIRTGHYLAFIFSSVLVFLLDSKLGYILFFILVTTIFFSTKKHLFKIRYIAAAAVSTVLIGALAFKFSSTFEHRATNMYNQFHDAITKDKFTGSTGTRLAWNILGMKIFMQHPLLGVGGFNHIDLAVEKIKNLEISQEEKNWLLVFENKITPQMQTLHNEYLDHLIQFGIIGLVLLLNIFYSIYKDKPQQDEELQVLKISMLSIFMIYCFVNYFFVLSQLGIIFFLLISLTLTSFNESKEINNA